MSLRMNFPFVGQPRMVEIRWKPQAADMQQGKVQREGKWRPGNIPFFGTGRPSQQVQSFKLQRVETQLRHALLEG